MSSIKSIYLGCMLVAVGVTACSEATDSNNIKTGGIYAAIDVKTGNANSSDVEVTLKVGGANSNTYVDLSSNDKLTATLNNTEARVLGRQEKTKNHISYVTTFSGATAGMENSSYKITFDRAVETSAPNSSVTLPTPVANLAISRSDFSAANDLVTLTWAGLNSQKSLRLSIAGDCIVGSTLDVADMGTYVINAGTIKGISPRISQNCSVTFTFTRETNGSLDPAYGEGGYVKAKSSRSVSATVSLL